MAKKKEKKPTSIDDVLADLQKGHSKDLDAAFKASDAFMKEEHQNHLYNNIFSPAQDELYGAIKSELDKAFEGDEAKVHGKKEQIKKAIAQGLRKYFDKTQPSLTKILNDMKMDEGEQYDFLTQMYDEHVGVGKIKDLQSITALVDYAKDKRKTVGHVKRHLYEQKTKHIGGALALLQNQHLSHHFNKFHKTAIAAYLKPKLEKAGYEIEDKLGYATADFGDLLALRKGLIEKEGHPYLKKKEGKEK